MATTFAKILIHFVFSTKDRSPLITPEIESDLYAYMVGIARHHECWTMAINGMPDHIHMLISMSKKMTVSDFMENVKGDSARWINERLKRRGTFWQEGYGAFSIGESGIPALKQYIATQKDHHQRMTFQEELLKLLAKYDVEYDERYIWT